MAKTLKQNERDAELAFLILEVQRLAEQRERRELEEFEEKWTQDEYSELIEVFRDTGGLSVMRK